MRCASFSPNSDPPAEEEHGTVALQPGSMSQHELRNVLFARGPSFKQGVKLDTPSRNTDLAPTVLLLAVLCCPLSLWERVRVRVPKVLYMCSRTLRPLPRGEGAIPCPKRSSGDVLEEALANGPDARAIH